MAEDTCLNIRAFLTKSQNRDGGWPYVPGKASAAEPTAYAAMALASSVRGTAGLGSGWLAKHAPGASSFAGVDPVWRKSLALLALVRLDGAAVARQALVRELLEAKGQQGSGSDFNNKLIGWSWAAGTFSWVEPTGYAIIALKAAGVRSHARLTEAEALLMDRVCADGGWNYGNPRALGANLPAMPGPTAVAALALQGVPAAAELVPKALDYLAAEVRQRPSSLSLSLAALCSIAYGRPAEPFVAALHARVLADGSCRGQVQLSALALLALEAARGGPNVFKL